MQPLAQATGLILSDGNGSEGFSQFAHACALDGRLLADTCEGASELIELDFGSLGSFSGGSCLLLKGNNLALNVLQGWGGSCRSGGGDSYQSRQGEEHPDHPGRFHLVRLTGHLS